MHKKTHCFLANAQLRSSDLPAQPLMKQYTKLYYPALEKTKKTKKPHKKIPEASECNRESASDLRECKVLVSCTMK